MTMYLEAGGEVSNDRVGGGHVRRFGCRNFTEVLRLS